MTIDDQSARRCLTQARRHGPPGLALGQKITGGGAVESSARGATVVLSDGRTALDLGSYAVALLGHLHPAVTEAVREQLDVMAASTRTLANPLTNELAATLVELLQPSRLQRVWFGQNGADAVEAALKLARLATGRSRILAAEGGYHGKSLGALAATWSPRYRAGLTHLLAPTTHLRRDDPDAVAAELAGGDVAALIVEPIQGESGVVPLSPDVLHRWAADARAAGVLLIADEVQCGLWRAGEPSLAVDIGLDPDAVLLGKPLGGGIMPLAAAVCSERLYSPLAADPFAHTTTFSGHPLACAAGLAALRALGDLAPRIRQLGERFASGLAKVAADRADLVIRVRGRGLIWGLELIDSAYAGAVLTELSDAGLIVSPCLGRPEVIRLLPPAVLSDDQIDQAMAILAGALDDAAVDSDARATSIA